MDQAAATPAEPDLGERRSGGGADRFMPARASTAIRCGDSSYGTLWAGLTHLASRDTIASGPIENTPENLKYGLQI